MFDMYDMISCIYLLFQLLIMGYSGNNNQGDLAIDDLSIEACEECQCMLFYAS